MQGKAGHKAQHSHGEDTAWEIKRISVPVCTLCDTEIQGNGSVVTPYKCECSQYEWDGCAYNERIKKDED